MPCPSIDLDSHPAQAQVTFRDNFNVNLTEKLQEPASSVYLLQDSQSSLCLVVQTEN